MSRTCEVCVHPQVNQINEDLSPIKDMPLLAVVEKYGFVFSKDSAHRHRLNHLAPAFRNEVAIQTRAEAFANQSNSLRELAGKMGEVIAFAEEVRERAFLAGNDDRVLKANSEVRATLTAVAKFLSIGENGGSPSATNEELQAARALVLALRIIMPMFPEAFQALMTELQAQNEFALAAQLESYVNHRRRSGA